MTQCNALNAKLSNSQLNKLNRYSGNCKSFIKCGW